MQDMSLFGVGSRNEQYQKDLERVSQDGLELVWVNNQTPELCMAAVKQNGWALEYVKEQTHELC
ncbi:hypothetical protein D7Y41_06410, partial [Anaerotruncus sp. 1XD22-93]